MSSFGVEKTLELLASLQVGVRDFAAREEKLNCEYRVKIAAQRQQRDKALEQLAGELSVNIEKTTSHFSEAKVVLETKYKSRKARIVQAHRNSSKQASDRIEYKEGVRKHKLQMETMQATRNRKNGLVATEQAYEEFKNNLAVEEEVLAVLETQAQKACSGFGKFKRMLAGHGVPPSGGLSMRPPEGETPNEADEYQMLSEIRETLGRARDDLKRFRKLLLPTFFKFRLLWFVLMLGLIPLVPLLNHFGINSFSYSQAIGSAAGCLIAGFILHQLAQRQVAASAKNIADALVKARQIHQTAFEKCEARFRSETERIEAEHQNLTQWVDQEWAAAVEQAAAARDAYPRKIIEKEKRASEKHERAFRSKLQKLESEHAANLVRFQNEAEGRRKTLRTTTEEKETKITDDHQTQWQLLETDWRNQMQPIVETVKAANAWSGKLFPTWNATEQGSWTPPQRFEHAARFARLEVDVEKVSENSPKDKRLAFPGSSRFSMPLLLTYPDQGSLLLETTGASGDAIGSLNSIMLRLLATTPPGKLSFTVVDPVGLGQNFSSVMHLADYAEHLINGRIWTQASQIEEKLADLNEHIEKVIQMYLRNEYATVAEYNEQAGNIAEKYHFLVVADFPANFTETAIKRLLSIASSGARCGVYTLIHWNRSLPTPIGFIPEELKKSGVHILAKGNQMTLAGKALPGTNLVLDTPPSPEFTTEFIHQVGKSSRDSNRVEVPFSHVAPDDASLWTMETTSELRVAIGRTGATKLQQLAIGKGTRQHALLAGKTGSGKSTLFHVIVTNLALWCSPEQVEFYLVDFKKGVEFKCYATHRLPHARVVAIESDREFGLSVLQRVDDELKRRGEMFRKLGVQDIAGYKKAGGTGPIPRTLLIIDEFQEFFVEEDRISQNASVLLDRIVRQGRAFGIHVLLGSQTLGGAYTMARTTIGQMVIRIALQCNEADAYLIMDDSNPAPRLLSRPGEGIYNDSAGAKEGNSPFQAVWLPDDVRDTYLEKVRLYANEKPTSLPAPIVFEGDAPADVRENQILQGLLETKPVKAPSAARIWLGAPNSIKGPTEAVFQRQSGNNLLMVGQRDEAVIAILSVALVSLAAQHPRGSVRFIVFDGSAPGSVEQAYLEKIVRAIPHNITLARNSDAEEIMNGLSAEMKRRTEEQAADAPAIFLFVHGLQKFSKLRYEEDFSFSSDDSETATNPASHFNKVICEGTSLGFHVVVTCDTYNNVNRFLSKKAFSEFEMRVLFQMSANDSASLIDNPKAGTLGLHRALFYNEQQGHLELFRPYALPNDRWLEFVGEKLRAT